MKIKRSGLKNRISHYCFLLISLLGFSVGGLVTLNCAQVLGENYYSLQQAVGVDKGGNGQIEFSKLAKDPPTATLNVPKTLTIKGEKVAIIWRCPDLTTPGIDMNEFTDGTITVDHPGLITGSQDPKVYRLHCLAFETSDVNFSTHVATLYIPVVHDIPGDPFFD